MAMKRVRRRTPAPDTTTTTTTPPMDVATPVLRGPEPAGTAVQGSGAPAAVEGSNPSASTTTASRLPKAPTGPIQTAAPQGGSFGIDWEVINQYDELIARACDEARVPFGRLKAVIPIESRGNRRAVQKNDANGWSYGLVQVVPYGNGWDRAALIARIAGLGSSYTRQQIIDALYDPAINLRVGAAILRGYYDQHGSWDAANSAFFTGKPDWLGSDAVNATTGQQYRRSLDGLLSEIWTADRETTSGEGAYTFGLPAWPRGFDRRILDLAGNGAGWDALGSRTAGMGLLVGHHTAGYDNRDSVYRLFSRGGGRWGQACTDAVIDRAGLGYLMLDPWSPDPDEGSGVTPWASGPATSLNGIGVPIVQQLGANAVNKRGFSGEHCNVSGQGFTDAQMALSCAVYGNVITRMRIPWDRFPVNPNLNNLRVDAVHDRFAPTSCPGADWPWGGGVHTAWVQGIVAAAKALQTGSAPGVPVPVPEPEPLPDPATFTAYGLERAQIDRYFGTLTRFNLDGTTSKLPFDPQGPLSLLWLERFGDAGIFPAANEMQAFDSKVAPGREWFARFGDYVAWLPLDNNRATWRWLDQTEVPA